jgi:hypothetical protein
MPITVKHTKVSTIPDDSDTSLVRPSDWNADHTLVGLGTMAEQNANAVAITGGTISGVTLPASNITGTLGVPNGGTGATTLTGYVKGTGTAPLTASATIPNTDITGLGTASTKDAGVANGVATLDAGGKVPVSELPAAVLGALSYQGTWDAATNTPTLTSSVGTKGYYYVVNVAGNTNLNGITDWLVGDWAVYNGTVWQKVDNTDAVTSVNGLTGTVVLTTTNIAEGTNLYYTDARARAAISAGTGISYDNATGVVTNAAPDQTVALTDGTAIDVTGTYPNFTINNTAPDQTVVLTAGTGISTSGTYPNFTIANTAPSLGGDVVGPASATDNAVARYDLTTGKLIQNSAVIIDDSNNVTGVNTLTATNLVVNDDTTLGGSNADTLDVRARITSDLEPNANNAKDIGTSGRNWRDAFFGRTVHTVNLELTGTTSFDGSQGTSGQVLTSAGTGNTPTWTTPTTGTVTSVSGTGTVNGISLSGTVTSSGNLTLGGTLSGVDLTTQVTGTLPVANGGTGLTSLTANRIPYGNDTSAYQSSANLTFNGTTLVANDITDSSLTAGRVTYAGTGGNLVDSANLTWDNTNARLGVGTASPSQALQVTTGGDTAALISSSASSTGNSARIDFTTGVKSFALQNFNAAGTAVGSSFRLFDNTRTVEVWRADNAGNLLVGTTTSPSGSSNLSVQGGQLVLGGTNVLGAGNATGSKNYLINGNFDIWQRGTTNTLTTAGYTVADRWQYINDGTLSTGTVFTRQTFTPGQTNVPNNPTYFLQTQYTSVNTPSNYIRQRIENVATCSGQTVTMSAWVRAASGTIDFNFQFQQEFGTGGSPGTPVYGIGVTNFTATTTWTRFTATIAIPSISGKGIGTNNDSALNACIVFPATGSGTIQVAQCQVEIGSAATSYDLRPVATEYPMCLRYFYQGVISGGGCSGGGNQFPYVSFPQAMRTTPTITRVSGGRIGNGVADTAVVALTGVISGTNVDTVLIIDTGPFGIGGQGIVLYNSPIFILNAEL